jgi:hypothetical protein
VPPAAETIDELRKERFRGGRADFILRATGKTVVIPGHGPVGGKADLTMFRDVVVEVRDKVMALKKQARSLSETIAA